MIDGILEDLIRLQIRQSITMPLSNWLNTALGVATATGTPGTPAAGAPASSIRGYATGGVFGGGLRIVGENGPELEATGPSRIYNASQTRDMLGGGSSLVTNITINVQGGGGNDGAMAENIARQVAIAQEQSMAKFTRQQQKIGGMFNSSSVIS
jgi:hypothetical protein